MGREVYGSYTNLNDSLTAANKAITTREPAVDYTAYGLPLVQDINVSPAQFLGWTTMG